jgi:hypothetical protein
MMGCSGGHLKFLTKISYIIKIIILSMRFLCDPKIRKITKKDKEWFIEVSTDKPLEVNCSCNCTKLQCIQEVYETILAQCEKCDHYLMIYKYRDLPV